MEGRRGIRTPGTVTGSAVFKTAAFDHSAEGGFDHDCQFDSNSSMPMFILHANFAISDEKASLIQEDAVFVLSEGLGKSKDFIVTLFHDSASIKFGQSKEPCSYVEIKNVGILSQSKRQQ